MLSIPIAHCHTAFLQEENNMSALSQTEKNRISALKEQLAKEIIQTSTLSTLTQIEKDFLNEILARHLKDKIGNYNARIKELFQDIYIVRGIKYRNIHLLNQSTYSISEQNS